MLEVQTIVHWSLPGIPIVAVAILNTFAIIEVFNPDPDGLNSFLFSFAFILSPTLAGSFLDTLHIVEEKPKYYNI